MTTTNLVYLKLSLQKICVEVQATWRHSTTVQTRLKLVRGKFKDGARSCQINTQFHVISPAKLEVLTSHFVSNAFHRAHEQLVTDLNLGLDSIAVATFLTPIYNLMLKLQAKLNKKCSAHAQRIIAQLSGLNETPHTAQPLEYE